MNSVETALFSKRTIRGFALVAAACSAFVLVGCGYTDKTAFRADYYTRGIGNYPGAPSEHFAPQMVKDDTYRNIALHRAAYHSSSYDYNLTAQLITDGIIATDEPNRLVVSTPKGTLPKREREWTIDGGPFSRNYLQGEDSYLEYHWTQEAFRSKRLQLEGSVAYQAETAVNGYEIDALVSVDGKDWECIGRLSGWGLPGEATDTKAPTDPNKSDGSVRTLPTRKLNSTLELNADKPFSFLRLRFRMKGAAYWSLTEVQFQDERRARITVLPSERFDSTWMSAEGGEQWVYVDLGTKAEFDRIKLCWIRKARQGQIEISDDATTWTKIAVLPGGTAATDEIECKGKARYVRVLMQQPDESGHYLLSEMEVYGKGGLTALPAEERGMHAGKYFLSGGNWKLCRASAVTAGGETISTEHFDTSGWIPATVPGTVLTSYMNVGAVPNPNYADNLLMISESYFHENFWYRNEFEIPQAYAGKNVCLNFDGINWKAEIYLNGKKLDAISGAFVRGKFPIGHLIKKGKNTLAVEIIRNAHYGAVKEKCEKNTDFNGGILGADNPTFHATIGWDWISTVRGRNMGIWNNVFLSASGKITVQDPLIVSKLALPDTLATLTPSAVVINHAAETVKGKLSGFVGEIRFEKEIELLPNSKQQIDFLPEEFGQLKNRQLKLWWPNGYGTPYLYEAGFTVSVDGKISDTLRFKAGIRQMDYQDVNTRLKLYVNGKRFIPLGGNWGFSEHNLNYRAREYDVAVRYHQEMNFNMIRNWVGQIGDEPFYEACDKYGILVWQDFWLANPVDGPDPYDEPMFMTNAEDYVKRIRNHASIGLYCGRNEGYPPPTLDRAFRKYVRTLHPDIAYISSSADEGVSGHGPYRALSAKTYFELVPAKLHSERGMPNVMNMESLNRTLSPATLWPQDDRWGQHDYTMEGAQRGASFNELIAKGFRKPESAKEFTELAQWINYNGYRAMYESSNVNRWGLIIWMSHPCWPSMVWQTYDYFFEPTAAYFGAKKACEPLHIQWNEATDSIEVVDLYAGDRKGLKAELTVRNMRGEALKTTTISPLDIRNDTTTPITKVGKYEDLAENYTEQTDVLYIDLKLYDEHGEILSENFYLKGKEYGNYQALNQLPKMTPTVDFEYSKTGNTWNGKVHIGNQTKIPSLLIRLNVLGEDGEQILPLIYSDNYFSLMPGEKKEVALQWKEEDTRGKRPHLSVTGFNVK